ncbi:MAG: hypothetical protein ABJF11_06670 [Reichenbachiella sp.]|uniref:hypothetical protein n=1 Tax=Reichenbachiella sp. TaxID=2184521 RepID=UPI00326422A9
MKLAFYTMLILVLGLSACDEDDVPKNTFTIPELGKPIVFDYNPASQSAFEDTYYEMDLNFYIPEGIEDLKNRPLLFTISTLRNGSVTGSMIEIIQREGMIAVSPKNGEQQQFQLFLEALIDTEYVDPSNVYLAGFSAGGFHAYELAQLVQNKVRGIVLLDPANFNSFEPEENSSLSLCIVCQYDRIERYAQTVAELTAYGMSTKVIAVEGTDHFGILSTFTKQEKSECFDFVKNVD